MRVLLDCRMATWGGIGRYCQGLVRALVQLRGLDLVQMVAPASLVPAPDSEVVEAVEHPFSVAGAIEFGRIARRMAPDVTHALHFPVPLPAAHPLVVTIQDITPLLVPGVMPSAAKRAVYHFKLRRAIAVADRVLTPSRCTAEDVTAFMPSAAPKVRPILLAADDFTAGPMGALPGWLVGRRYVLSMGNTKLHKDLPTLLRAFAALDEEDLLLVLAGKDPGGYAASILGGDPAAVRVRFTGSISDDTLRALYAGAVLLAFPSRYEGFGLPPLEALSLGTPVVVAAAGSLREVVGDAGLMVAPADPAALAGAMGLLLRDRALAERLRARGYQRAAEFSWRHTAEQTAVVYREVAR
ncbi:MAG: glycosyltransferase family 4 protein [Coriobacteriia bacterium]